jgi:hypothetical protein
MVARPQTTSRTRVAVSSVPIRDASRIASFSFALLVLAVVLLCTATSARAAAGEVDWAKPWNAPRPGQVYVAKAQARPGGGVYVAASLRRPSGNVDIVVLSYSAGGRRVWVRPYDGPAHGLDWVKGIAVDRDGNVVVCGSSYSAAGREDWIVLKYGPNGKRRWARRLAGSFGRADVPEAVAVDTRGNAVVVGSITRRKTGGDWCVVKYGPGGALLWRTTMTRSVAGRDQALALVIDPGNAHIFVTGRMFGSISGDDAVTVSYRPDGLRVWRQRWDGTAGGPDAGLAIALSAQGLAVAGVTGSPGSGDDGLVLKYAKSGVPRWAKVVDGGQGASGVDRFATVGIDTAGNVVAGGSVTTSAAQGEDLTVVRYRAGGAPGGWWQLPGAGANETALDLRVTPGGDTYAVGTSAGGSSGDAVVAGLSTGLSPLWSTLTYDRANGDDLAQSLTLSSGALYVAGVSGADLLVMKIAR